MADNDRTLEVPLGSPTLANTDLISGEIDSARKSQEEVDRRRMMGLNLHAPPAARDWFHRTRESMKPWSEFIAPARFKYPTRWTPKCIGSRVVRNIEHFQGNYLCVFAVLAIFSVLTSPMLLIALALCLGACYMIFLKNQQHKLKLLGREVAIAHQYTAVAICSFPLFYLTGATSAILWLLGASFVVILVHAMFYEKPTNDEEEELLEMEMV